MEYEHLFAESDIEETDSQTRPESFSAQPPTSGTAANFVFGRYMSSPQRQSRCLDCNFCQNRPRREHLSVPVDNSPDEYENYRRKRLRMREKKSSHMSSQHMNSHSVAGPSRLADGPVDYRYVFTLKKNYNFSMKFLRRHADFRSDPSYDFCDHLKIEQLCRTSCYLIYIFSLN